MIPAEYHLGTAMICFGIVIGFLAGLLAGRQIWHCSSQQERERR
jgi:hypothetical protein